jgi:LPS export ABC transporter protein LptC
VRETEVRTPEPRLLLAFALLLAGAIISSFVAMGTRSDKAKDARPELSLAFYLDRAEITGTGEDGELRYQVWTEKASQATSESSVDLTRIRMRYGDSEGSWELKANAARIPPESNMIMLRGNVIAASTDDENNTTVIRTQQLNIDTDAQEANTPRKVVLEFNGNKLNATGMYADFENNQLKLLSNVNGKFLP